MNYAYIRVSTEVQSYEGQRFEIENWSRKNEIPIHHWVQEKVSGTKRIDKRTLGKLLRRMRKGDILVCTELSRLGRNMMMVMAILNTCSQKGIQIRSIKDNFELSDSLNSKIIALPSPWRRKSNVTLFHNARARRWPPGGAPASNWAAPPGRPSSGKPSFPIMKPSFETWLKGAPSRTKPGGSRCIRTPSPAI